MNRNNNLKPDRKKLLREIYHMLKFGSSLNVPHSFEVNTIKNEYSVKKDGKTEHITPEQYRSLKEIFPDVITFRIIPASDQDKYKSDNSEGKVPTGEERVTGFNYIVPSEADLGPNTISVDVDDMKL